jgi:hypothetical protein
MVFGNLSMHGSGTGVAFTRNPATGEAVFYGEYLENAEGEDVVSGIRTPESLDFLKKNYPELYDQVGGCLGKGEGEEGGGDDDDDDRKEDGTVAEEGMLMLMLTVLVCSCSRRRSGWRTTTRTCRTSSSPSRRARSTSYRPAPASALPRSVDKRHIRTHAQT